MDLLARAIVYVELLLSAALLLPIAAVLGVISLALRGLESNLPSSKRRFLTPWAREQHFQRLFL